MSSVRLPVVQPSDIKMIARGVARDSNTEAINALIHSACEDLSITGEQLYAELEEGGDLPDIYSGTLTPKVLRLTAETLALMRDSMTSAEKHVRGNSAAFG